MIRIIAFTKENEMLDNVSLERISKSDIEWSWVDFSCPTQSEITLLDTHFHFHPLAIEDCLDPLQRPKLDHYDDHHFIILNRINESNLRRDEIDIFLSKSCIVTFHKKLMQELDEFAAELQSNPQYGSQGTVFALYLLLDKIVDHYFPSVVKNEERVDLLEVHMRESANNLMEELFDVRTDLLRLRKVIYPMRDLLYSIIFLEKIDVAKDHQAYFKDIHDHLEKLGEMVDDQRDMTSDIRESFVSVNSYRMHAIMKTLTVITTIFMPLTFIAGIYGMNFVNMPELEWYYGYGAVMLGMLAIGGGMFIWFKRKGWFRE